MRYLRALSILLFVAAVLSLGFVLLDKGSATRATQTVRRPESDLKQYDTLQEAARAAGFPVPSPSAQGWAYVPGTAYVRKLKIAGARENVLVNATFREEQSKANFELTVISQE